MFRGSRGAKRQGTNAIERVISARLMGGTWRGARPSL